MIQNSVVKVELDILHFLQLITTVPYCVNNKLIKQMVQLKL